MTDRDAMLATLRAQGRRITPQRQLVLDVIETSGEHLDAEAVYQRAHEHDPRISLATVYRTLAVLKDMGLVEQRYLSRNHAREHYEPLGAPEHYHFTCRACGQAVEFQSRHVQRMRDEVARMLGAEVAQACVCLEGYCAQCAAARRLQGSGGAAAGQEKDQPA
jgi:Fur family ferric uptake transcriptional regulator